LGKPTLSTISFLNQSEKSHAPEAKQIENSTKIKTNSSGNEKALQSSCVDRSETPHDLVSSISEFSQFHDNRKHSSPSESNHQPNDSLGFSKDSKETL
jgi:hypothetical protein